MPPLGSLTSPLRLGIKCIWQWKIVCPASSPQLMPILNPVTVESSGSIEGLYSDLLSTVTSCGVYERRRRVSQRIQL